MQRQTKKDRLSRKPQLPETITISFTVDAGSFEGQMLTVATKHYLAGVPLEYAGAATQRCFSAVGKMIVTDWLQHRVDFPPLEIGVTKYPLQPIQKAG